MVENAQTAGSPLDLPERLDDSSRLRWLERLAREWGEPAHGRLGGAVLLVRVIRAELESYVDPLDAWGRYTDEEIIHNITLHAEARAWADSLFGVTDDRAWQERFAVSTPTAWADLKWDLVVASMPASIAWSALKLDVASAPAMTTMLRRLAKQSPGAWGLLAALVFENVPPSTPLGKVLARRVFPTLAATAIEQIGRDARQRLRKMAWRHLPEPVRYRLAKDRGKAAWDDLDAHVWEAAVELCRGRAVPDLLLMALRGELDEFPVRVASRMQDADRRERPEGDIMTTGEREPLVVSSLSHPHSEAADVTVRIDDGTASLTWGAEWRAWRRAQATREDAAMDLPMALARLRGHPDPKIREGIAILIAREVDGASWDDVVRHFGKRRFGKRRFRGSLRTLQDREAKARDLLRDLLSFPGRPRS